MKVLSLGMDNNIFKPGSRGRDYAVEYGSLVDELHIVAYTLKKHGVAKKMQQISRNVFVYPTNLKWRIMYPFVTFWFCLELIKKRGMDQTNSLITSQEGMTNVPATWLSRLTKIPLQVQIHTDFLSPHYSIGLFRTWLQKLGYSIGIKRAKCIRVVSNRIKRSLVERYNTDPNKIIVLPIRAEIEIYKSAKMKMDLHRRFPQFSFIILMVSRLEREKDYPLALKVLKKMAKRYPKIGMIIVGKGSQKEKIQNLVSKLNLDTNVVLEDWQDQDALASYYHSADIYLLTSKYEGYGLSLIEAAVSGCPIITTDVGLAGDVLTSESAVIVPVGDEKALLVAIDRLIKVPDLRRMLADRAKQEVAKLPSKVEYLAQYKKIWDSSCN